MGGRAAAVVPPRRTPTGSTARGGPSASMRSASEPCCPTPSSVITRDPAFPSMRRAASTSMPRCSSFRPGRSPPTPSSTSCSGRGRCSAWRSIPRAIPAKPTSAPPGRCRCSTIFFVEATFGGSIHDGPLTSAPPVYRSAYGCRLNFHEFGLRRPAAGRELAHHGDGRAHVERHLLPAQRRPHDLRRPHRLQVQLKLRGRRQGLSGPG